MYGYTSKGKVCSQCKECIAVYQKAYRAKNADKRKSDHYAWRVKNRKKLKAYNNVSYKANIERIQKRHSEYKKINKDKVKAQNAAYQRRKIAEDPIFKMKAILRNLVYDALRRKGYTKNNRTIDIVGMRGEELYQHLLSGFFDVYGRLPTQDDQLDIDHIVPLITAKTEEEVLKLNHYTNLRFLLKHDNRYSKNAKLDWSP